MKEPELLAVLATKFERVSADVQVLNAEDDKGVTTKSVNVFATDMIGEFPIAVCKNILYYVLDAGKATESAYVHEAMPAMIIPEA